MQITLTADRVAEIRTGDRITALNGHQLRRPVVVSLPLADGRIGLEAPEASLVEHWLYPDTQMDKSVTIERPEPVAAPAPKPKAPAARRRRIVAGVELLPDAETGGYITADGHWSFQYNWFLTSCDDAPHPVRYARKDWRYDYTGQLVRGEVCPGGQEHTSWAWFVYEAQADGQFEKADAADTLREAVEITFGKRA